MASQLDRTLVGINHKEDAYGSELVTPEDRGQELIQKYFGLGERLRYNVLSRIEITSPHSGIRYEIGADFATWRVAKEADFGTACPEGRFCVYAVPEIERGCYLPVADMVASMGIALCSNERAFVTTGVPDRRFPYHLVPTVTPPFRPFPSEE